MLENFQDISELHKIIVFQTGDKVGKIAKRVEYSREHLTGLLKGRGPEKVIRELREKLATSYQKEILQFVGKYSKVNSTAPEIDIEELAEHQRALLEIVLLIAKDKKTVYRESLAVLKKRGLSGIVGGMGM